MNVMAILKTILVLLLNCDTLHLEAYVGLWVC